MPVHWHQVRPFQWLLGDPGVPHLAYCVDFLGAVVFQVHHVRVQDLREHDGQPGRTVTPLPVPVEQTDRYPPVLHFGG